MPIYEYQCKACDIVSDFLQKMSDEPMLTCPECNEDALKKLISAPRFRLAGSGWYETDFKKGDNKRNLVSGDDKKTEAKTPEDKTSVAEKPESKSSDPSKLNGSETKSTKTESKTESKTKNTVKNTGSTTKDNGKVA